MKTFTPLKKIYFIAICANLLFMLPGCMRINSSGETENDGDEMYDSPDKAAEFQINRTKNPFTGKVPTDKMWEAVLLTKQLKEQYANSPNAISSLTWTERGSYTDAVGPSNGNTRANSGVTSGRIDAILVDKADATGKTIFVGGDMGGIWKTTDITASPATWTLVSDYLGNMIISSITQDPTNSNTMYFSTGEAYYGGELGLGVFKSTDHGVTWNQLPSTSAFTRTSRILCDYLGNIYLGSNGITSGAGLMRSTDGGSTWTDITPAGLSNRICDLEISSTTAAGRLHVVTGIASTMGYRYTDIPATVTSGTWTTPATTFVTGSQRAEIAVSGNTLFACPDDATGQVPTIYKSTDGGNNWAATGGQPTSGWASQQGWYALSVAINPSNSNQCIVGGLDNYKTTNGGTSWTAISAWVGTTGQYVHADQHTSLWYDNGNKLLFGCDGGIFYSADGGTNIADRNVGLRLKEFYSCAIHPTLTNYFIAGAQDNGTHVLNGAGLTSSVEVTGGDGAYVDIDQDQSQYQFGAYVYNQYRKSTDNGASWSSVNFSASAGLFINPFDYDDVGNKLYASYTAGQYLRWSNPQTGSTASAVSITAFNSAQVSAVAVSPYTANRVYFGTTAGRIVQVNSADAVTPTATNISDAGMSGYANAIIHGTDDQNLMACFSSYGVTNVWLTTNGGTSWTACDGNLPDIPVYWACFYPNDNSRAYIATETGVWETDQLNGASTVWVPNGTFPTMRTTMLKYRSSDRTLLASTYGRGLWTATIPNVTTPDLQFSSQNASSTESTAFTSGCRGYTDYSASMQILNAPTGSGSATVTLSVAGGGTATQGIDYDVTTNGSFASPSMQMSFAVGSTTPQSFTIRVYDDGAIESGESFTLNYSLNPGTTNAQAGSSNQTYTFNITDNDAGPITPGSGTSSTIGTYNYVSTSGQSCFFSSVTRHKIQYLVTKAELNAAGISGATNLTSLKMRVVTKGSTKAFSGFTVSLGNTSTTTLSSGYASPTFTQVFSGAFTTVTGDNTISFSSNFAWDGTSNVVVNMCFQNASADAADDVLESDVTDAVNYLSVFANYTSGPTAGCSLPAFYISHVKPTMVFGYTITGTPVSTALNSTKTAYLGPNNDVYFYDGSGNIMARIKNLTSFDYGCTQVVIDRAGSSSAQFWNNAAANYLLSKSFKVIPTNNTSSGSYQVTLYYTAAEIAGWESATGRTWAGSAMQVAKVSNGNYVPDVTPALPHTADVSVVTGTKGTFGTNYTIRGDFSSTGFSGFGVGITGNPILTADFRTKGTNNFTTTTNWEYNNEGAGYVDANQAPGSDNNVNIVSGHVIALNSSFTINSGKTLTVNGTLNCGTNTVSGAGNFTTMGASTLGIGSGAGISSSGATGNIQTTGRTFSSTGNYTYNGAASQATGNGLPSSVNNLIVANTGAALSNIVTMDAGLTVNGSTTLTSGVLAMGSNTLTLNGTVGGSGTLSGTASGGLSTSNLVIGGTAGTLNFTQTTAATRSLNNLTLSSGSSATLGTALDVYGTIGLTTATLNLNGQNLTLKSNTNNTARIADLTGSTLSGATNVTMERWIKLRLGGTGRAYRLLAPTVNTAGSMNANWMEGGMNTSIGTNVNPLPLFGTQITGAGGNTNGFDKTATNQASVYNTTNGVTPTYTAIGTTTGALNALTGYFLYIRGDRSTDMQVPLAAGMPTSSTTLRTTGTILTGTKTSFTNAFTGGANTLNLVTNPYPSPIDWALVQPACTNIATSYTFWDPNFGARGGFVTVNTAGVASSGLGTRFIQTGQAFFVQSTGGIPTVSIQESHKTAGNNNEVFLTPPPPVPSFRTELYFTEPNGYRRIADGAIALYGDQYAATIDGDDASEVNNWDENIAISKDGKHLAIESRPVIRGSDSMLLFMNNMKQQGYEFEFTPSQFSNTSLKAELVDKFLGTRTVLSLIAPTVVSFAITADPASSAPDRFKVVFNAANPAIDAITIRASEKNGSVLLDWLIGSETGMDRYEVERSGDGSWFSKIFGIAAKGNSNVPVSYNGVDATPINGANFYRVKALDNQGNEKYSSIVKLLIGSGVPAFVVKPNPLNGDRFTLSLKNIPGGSYRLSLLNSMGQEVFSESLNHPGGNAEKLVELKDHFTAGIYLLRLRGAGGIDISGWVLIER